MQRITAIALLTLKAAFRFRLVVMLAVVLLGSVVVLPLIIKDDGVSRGFTQMSARGFTQIVLTYTLSVITGLLGFATLWLACGTLARDVEEAQIQLVAVKPVARWQIWIGKWLGILSLNALLLGLSGGAVFGMMHWRVARLPTDQQAILKNEVMVARGSARETVPDLNPFVEQELAARVEAAKTRGVQVTDLEFMRKQILEQIKAVRQIVRPEYIRPWAIDLGSAAGQLVDQPLFVRTKFNAAQPTTSGTYTTVWEIGDPATGRVYQTNITMATDTFYEFQIPPNLINNAGVLHVRFYNPTESALLFPLEDGLEVLYREGAFALNFARGVAIIFCWLALLAAIGLAASSFLSFPVAAFVSLGMLVVAFSSGTISLVIEQGTVFEVNHDTGVADEPRALDHVALPVFKVLLKVIKLVRGFSPIDSLSTGRSISWGDLAQAFSQICLLLGGIISLIGITIFTRRELASAQSNH